MAETDQVYPLDPEKVYYSMDELTLDTDEGPKTLRVGSWLNYDPVRIHRMIVREKTMQVDTFEVYNPLMSKLRRADQQYYKQFMGLGLTIDFPGYTSEILARIPFENDPIGLQMVAQGKARGQGLSFQGQPVQTVPESRLDGA